MITPFYFENPDSWVYIAKLLIHFHHFSEFVFLGFSSFCLLKCVSKDECTNLLKFDQRNDD